MIGKKHHWWRELNQFVDDALNEMVFLPKRFVRHIHPDCQRRMFRHETEPDPEFKVDSEVAAEPAIPTQAAFLREAANSCPGCGDDIITRAHSRQAKNYSRASNTSFHDWMLNDIDRLDPYGDAPHPSGFEQNVEGMKEEHLQRVEQYWSDHQLSTPTSCSQCKSSRCATIEEWNLSQSKAMEEEA